jgi:microcystin-dependent protein
VPTGGVIPFGGQIAPGGFLLCQGQAVSRATYATLFSIIGVSFGAGDGVTTFNIPNMINRFPRGVANAGSDFPGVTQAAGTDNIGTHTHTYATDGQGNFGSNNYLVPPTPSTDSAGDHTHAVVTPPNVGFNYIIKT